MAKLVPVYLIALVIFLAIDMLWLGVVARNFYAERMAGLLADQPRWGVAAVFYAVFVIGLMYFAISGHLAAGDWKGAVVAGALFGFFTYLTYDATNLAVLKGYDTTVAIVDTIWGTVLGGAVSGVTVAIASRFGLGA